jgi:hypothetical protein
MPTLINDPITLHTDHTKHHKTTPRQHIVTIVCKQLESLVGQTDLDQLHAKVIHEYSDVFVDILHLDELPTNVYCRIVLKDPSKTITTCTYSTPRKYKDTWGVLIKQHLNAGHIRPSNSTYASPAFLVPKSDLTALPHWVNDY